MKQVVSISIGSSKRDHEVELEVLGESVRIWREGTDGNVEKAVQKIQTYDGHVDAFGLGGTTIVFVANGHTYHLRDGKQFAKAAKETPILDGMGLKNAYEGDVVRFLEEEHQLVVGGKKVLITSCLDRWGLAMAFDKAGCHVTYADLLFALGLPVLFHSKTSIARMIRIACPIVMQLPFEMLYPYESDHTSEAKSDPRYSRLYQENDIVAGDYKYIKQYMPDDMEGKWIVTNTTTPQDVEYLRNHGVELLVTTTPRLGGRSFGTNVMEATLVALAGSSRPLMENQYLDLSRKVGFKPDVLWLQEGKAKKAG